MSDKEKVEDNAEEIEAVEAQEDAEAVDEVTEVSEVDALTEEIGQLKDQMLRVQADAANVRRRAEIDVQNAHKFGQEKLIKELVQVVDNLERGLQVVNQDDEGQKAIGEGIELTLKSLMSALSKSNVEVVDPSGQPFDPALHQAMTMIPSADVEPNTVIDTMQKGYTLHGRVVRPAMVVVSKAAE